jgi:hypothetical protein
MFLHKSFPGVALNTISSGKLRTPLSYRKPFLKALSLLALHLSKKNRVITLGKNEK